MVFQYIYCMAKHEPACAGGITVVIETKLDVRDGAAWTQFDRAIHRLEGGAEEGGPDAAVGQQSPLLGDSDDDLPLSVLPICFSLP